MKSKSALLASMILGTAFALGLAQAFSVTTEAALADLIALEVDTTVDSNDMAYQACTSGTDDRSLRGAISKANADPTNAYVINLPSGTYGLTLTGVREDHNATGDLDLDGNITLVGTGVFSTVISAGRRDRVIQVNGSAVVTIDGVTITGGQTPIGTDGGADQIGGSGEPGGGIYNAGTLTLAGSTVRDNVTGAGGRGGGHPVPESGSTPFPPNLRGHTGRQRWKWWRHLQRRHADHESQHPIGQRHRRWRTGRARMGRRGG